MSDYIMINPNDNVCVALKDMSAGTAVVVAEKEVELLDDIHKGHKFAITDIGKSDSIVKYGYPIGFAKCDIRPGEHVHVDNIMTALSDNLTYEYKPGDCTVDKRDLSEDRQYFMGYERTDGTVGIRNELWIVPTVGCVNAIAKTIADLNSDFVGEGVDAVMSFSHPYGCSQMGDDQENTRLALADLIKHPNAGGVLVLGLGCENSNITEIQRYLGDYDKARIRFLVCQDVEDEIGEGSKIVAELAKIMRLDKRTRQSISKLVIGLKCGGSDGLSGITANPVVGAFSDILTCNGGSTILTEVPEMFGAETILMNRAKDHEVFDKIVKLINDFKDYYRNHGQTIYENPSPGNKAGGISTLEDKALGCTQKSGSTPVNDVLAYGQRIQVQGLNLLSAPGNDLVAATALALSGAQIVLFTTGRGTPFAGPVPTVKISTNTSLYEKKSNWIDFDCGRLTCGQTTIDELSMDLYDYVLSIANGKMVRSESKGYCDFAIFKQGVTL